MNSIKSIFSFIGKLLASFLVFKPIFRLYNTVYERSDYWIVKLFVKFIPLPDKDNVWKILLTNKQTVNTQIAKGEKLTAEFALSYKWHSPALNKTEEILVNHTSSDAIWIDIGANMGLRSLTSLSMNRKVVFIEPNNKLNSINKERCIINHFTNIEFIEAGMSDKKGVAVFRIDSSSYKSTIENNQLNDSEVERIEKINIDTLDNQAQQKNWLKANIKIDVEGHELKVLKGAESFIRKTSPNIIIEVNEKGEHLKHFLEWASNFDYKVYEIGNFNKGKYFREISPQSLNSSVNDFLLTSDLSIINELIPYMIYN